MISDWNCIAGTAFCSRRYKGKERRSVLVSLNDSSNSIFNNETNFYDTLR
jgi:hypothetical protein